jgi:hypothetical protein
MNQHRTLDDNGARYPSSTAVMDTLMRAMAVRGFVLGAYALSFGIKDHQSILSHEVSESAAPQLTRDLKEAHCDSSAGNPR